MRISDWSSDVCSSDLFAARHFPPFVSSVVGTNGGRNGRYGLSRTDNQTAQKHQQSRKPVRPKLDQRIEPVFLQGPHLPHQPRSEEQTSELQSLMRSTYAVLCLKKKKPTNEDNT